MRSGRKPGAITLPRVVTVQKLKVRRQGPCAGADVALIRFVPGGIAMTTIDRAALIALLDRLGSDDDATVLEAARALHRQVTESGQSWDDLIRLDRDVDEAVSA